MPLIDWIKEYGWRPTLGWSLRVVVFSLIGSGACWVFIVFPAYVVLNGLDAALGTSLWAWAGPLTDTNLFLWGCVMVGTVNGVAHMIDEGMLPSASEAP